jgi:hypothetical protein
MNPPLAVLLGAEQLAPIVQRLPSGASVSIPHFLSREVRVVTPIERTPVCWAPNKPSLDYDGQATWAELVIVRLLQAAGWEARWIKNWVGGREFCVEIGQLLTMPSEPLAAFRKIDHRAASKTRGGAWDVFAWRDTDLLFLESKQYRSSDKLRPGQLAWLDAGMAEGYDLACFAVVDYDAGAPLTRQGAS